MSDNETAAEKVWNNDLILGRVFDTFDTANAPLGPGMERRLLSRLLVVDKRTFSLAARSLYREFTPEALGRVAAALCPPDRYNRYKYYVETVFLSKSFLNARQHASVPPRMTVELLINTFPNVSEIRYQDALDYEDLEMGAAINTIHLFGGAVSTVGTAEDPVVGDLHLRLSGVRNLKFLSGVRYGVKEGPGKMYRLRLFGLDIDEYDDEIGTLADPAHPLHDPDLRLVLRDVRVLRHFPSMTKAEFLDGLLPAFPNVERIANIYINGIGRDVASWNAFVQEYQTRIAAGNRALTSCSIDGILGPRVDSIDEVKNILNLPGTNDLYVMWKPVDLGREVSLYVKDMAGDKTRLLGQIKEGTYRSPVQTVAIYVPYRTVERMSPSDLGGYLASKVPLRRDLEIHMWRADEGKPRGVMDTEIARQERDLRWLAREVMAVRAALLREAGVDQSHIQGWKKLTAAEAAALVFDP